MFSKFITAAILAAALIMPVAAGAQSTSDEALKLHLLEAYRKSIAPGQIVKWEEPVRYRILGPVPESVRNYIKNQIADLASRAGIDIAEAGGDAKAPINIGPTNNLVFVLDHSIDPYLTDAKVIDMFEQDGETVEQTEARLKQDFANSFLFAGWLIDKKTIRRNIQILNISKVAREEAMQLFSLRMLFNALTSMTTSDGVQPSIMNSKPDAQLAPVDIAIVKSLYAAPRTVPHMSSLATVLDAYVAEIRKAGR